MTEPTTQEAPAPHAPEPIVPEALKTPDERIAWLRTDKASPLTIPGHHRAPEAEQAPNRELEAKFGRVGVAPHVTVPAEQVRTQIAAIRKELALERDDTPRQRELVARMEGLYKQLHPTPAVAVTTGDVTQAEAVIEPDGDDYTAALNAVQANPAAADAPGWDSAELADVRAAFRSRLAPSDLTTLFPMVLPVVQGALRRLAAGGSPDYATDEEILQEEWGDEYAAKRRAEDAAWEIIPATQQMALRRTRVNDDLDFRRLLADVGARLKGTR